MPRISKYYGIAIYMYYQDHAPPHFHAIYGEHEAVIGISGAKVLEGHCQAGLSSWSKHDKAPSEGIARELGAGPSGRVVATD